MFRRITLLTAGILSAWLGCSRGPSGTSQTNDLLRVGYSPGPLATPIYALAHRAALGEFAPGFTSVEFGSTAAIGYALLNGDLDAGLLATDQALHLLEEHPDQGLRVAGAVQFPYGATLVVRKDLKLRLGDLAGRKVAASSPSCKLLHQFQADVKRLAPEAGDLQWIYLPFDDMLPALEAREVDAVLTRGIYALIADGVGHKVLYQNWDVVGGDECCPAIISQLETLLVVRPLGTERINRLLHHLAEADHVPTPELRSVVSTQTRIPPDTLAAYPLPSFIPVNADIRKGLGDIAWNPEP